MNIKNINHFQNLEIDDILQIIKKAKEFKEILNSKDKIKIKELKSTLELKKIALCFFEKSTRTKLSFEIAAKNLGAELINLEINSSSIDKGETTLDTLKVIAKYGIDAFVIRHGLSGIIENLEKNINLPIINAGDGIHNHPTQALLDLMTVIEKICQDDLEKLKNLKLCIVGDILHSRVAKSNIELLSKFGVEINIFAPPTLFPYYLKIEGIKLMKNWNEVLDYSDVIMMLRLQNERMDNGFLPKSSEYHKYFGINQIIENRIREKQIFVMHPGPVNYGIEINESLNNYKNNLILDQVENGVYIRMAVMDYILN